MIQSPSEVLAAHRKLAAEFGNQPDRVVAEARARSQGRVQDRTAEGLRQVAQEAVTFARDRSFEREAVSDERTLFRDALRRGMGETTYAETRIAFEARVGAGEFRQVPGEKHDTGRRFTTPQTLRAEKEILDQMQQGRGQRKPILSIQEAVAHTESHPELNAAQRTAAEAILTSPDAVQGLQGFAGAGKTSALQAVREAAERKGYPVQGFAPTSRAARQLREAGIEADTLQRFLAGGRSETTGNPASRHLYMVDESSLANTQQVRDFLCRLDLNDRVLFVGDTRQHQGIEAGKPFEQLIQAGMKTPRLDQIVRQKDPELLRAVEHLSRNEIAEGIALLEQQGRVTEISDPQKRVAAIARSYAANPENTLVVSPDNASRREIKDAIRKELQTLGIVEKDELKLQVLVPRSEMTGADRTWAANYEIGDVLYYPRGSGSIGIEKQSYAAVVGVQPKENLLTVETENGKQITYNPSRLLGISAYRELERDFAVGDRLQFTAPSRDLGIANRDLGTVKEIDRGGLLSVRMDNGKNVLFDSNEMRHFDHGYAVTSYSSQGLTANRVLVNVDTSVHPDLIDSRFAYVSVSRAAEDAHIFTDAAPQLATTLAQSISKTSAIEMSVELGL